MKKFLFLPILLLASNLSPAQSPGNSDTESLTPVRAMGGIDVSAAASTDPAAKFLLDVAFEQPVTHSANNLPGSAVWLSGYVRLASIAQPGAISGLSDVATYLKPLADSTPSTLVQSAEAQFSVETKIFPYGDVSSGTEGAHGATSFRFVAEGGMITPLSPTKSQPVPYIVSQPLFNYYAAQPAQSLGAAAYAAVTSVCGTTLNQTTTPCYIAYVPQDRTRFYRSWDAGIRFKTYYKDVDKDDNPTDTYLFPSSMSLTVGQNEYVTAGMLRNFVLHAGGSLTVPPKIAPKLAGVLYAYGSVDMVLMVKNQSNQQFLLQPAPSGVTATTTSVAVVPVAAPNRDRYRFGLALDLTKVVAMLTKTKA